MNTRNISGLSLLLVLALAGNADAASLVLKPSDNMNVIDGVIQIGQGGTVNLDLQLVLTEGDTAPGHYGGEILVNYNTQDFGFSGFALKNATYFCDPQPPGGCAPIVTTSGTTQTVELGFENAYNSNVVGTFSFTANGSIGSLATLGLADADDFWGTFFSYEPAFTPMTLDFTGASVSTVPLPASIWLLGTAIGGLAARRRFRRTAG